MGGVLPIVCYCLPCQHQDCLVILDFSNELVPTPGFLLNCLIILDLTNARVYLVNWTNAGGLISRLDFTGNQRRGLCGPGLVLDFGPSPVLEGPLPLWRHLLWWWSPLLEGPLPFGGVGESSFRLSCCVCNILHCRHFIGFILVSSKQPAPTGFAVISFVLHCNPQTGSTASSPFYDPWHRVLFAIVTPS